MPLDAGARAVEIDEALVRTLTPTQRVNALICSILMRPGEARAAAMELLAAAVITTQELPVQERLALAEIFVEAAREIARCKVRT
jgi:hypothetical protein